MSIGKEQSVALGVTTKPEILNFFNRGIDTDPRRIGEHPVVAVLVYLNKWTGRHQVQWLGTSDDLSDKQKAAEFVLDQGYSKEPAPTDYTEALKNLAATIEVAPPGLLVHDISTQEEVEKWSRDTESRGF